MVRIITWLGIGVAVVSALGWAALGPAGTALADEALGKAKAGLTFGESVAAGEGVSLSVRLTTGDGQPIVREVVDFFVTPDFFGEQPVLLQRALTNAEGIATLTYAPTWNGTHAMTARFGGSADYQPRDVTMVMTVSGVAPLDLNDADSLGVVRLWAAPAVTLGAAIVWLIIAGVMIRVGWGVWHAGRRETWAPALPETAAERPAGSTYR